MLPKIICSYLNGSKILFYPDKSLIDIVDNPIVSWDAVLRFQNDGLHWCDFSASQLGNSPGNLRPKTWMLFLLHFWPTYIIIQEKQTIGHRMEEY